MRNLQYYIQSKFNRALRSATRWFGVIRLSKKLLIKWKWWAYSIIFAVSSRIDCSMHDRSELKSIIFIKNLSKRTYFIKKIYWILTFFAAWKLFHFRKGLTNCLFYILSFFEKHKVIYQIIKSGLTGHYSNIIHVYIRYLPPNVFESLIHFIHSLYLSTV